MNRKAFFPLTFSLKMTALTVTPAPPVGGVAVAVPLPILLAAGHAAGPCAISSAAVALHWVAPAPSIFVPLWSLITNALTPLGRPVAASGSANVVLNEMPVEAPSALVECLTLKVAISLA